MSAPRRTVEEILDEARQLPEAEQQRLVADLQGDPFPAVSEERRRAAMVRFLARSGTAHSDYTDVSARKNFYLTETDAAKP